MATHFRFAHEFDIDPKGYWEIFFDDAYNVELYKRTKIKNRNIVSQTDDGKVLRRTQRLTPDQELPGFIKSIINDVTYTEHDIFHRERSEMEVVIEPAMMKNKFDFRAIYSVKPVGAEGSGKCRRVFEGDSKVSVMLVGGQIEKYMIDEMRKSYDEAAKVTAEFIARRKAAV